MRVEIAVQWVECCGHVLPADVPEVLDPEWATISGGTQTVEVWKPLLGKRGKLVFVEDPEPDPN